MICKAIQILKPNVWKFHSVEIGKPLDDESVVDVSYSSLCCTDLQILNGSLLYYKKGIAEYPIITGHEWCGYLDGTPVTSLCIIGDQIKKRQELGVIGRNGSHAQKVIVPNKYIIEIPEVSPKYALLEPVAVVVHGLKRINIDNYFNILINGYGNIGKICNGILKHKNISATIYDPRLTDKVDYSQYDLLIECSGSSDGVDPYMSVCRGTILAFGFEYNSIDLGNLVANEINFISTLGSSLEDFVDAIDIMPYLSLPFQELNLSSFKKAIYLTKLSKKIVFNNRK